MDKDGFAHKVVWSRSKAEQPDLQHLLVATLLGECANGTDARRELSGSCRSSLVWRSPVIVLYAFGGLYSPVPSIVSLVQAVGRV